MKPHGIAAKEFYMKNIFKIACTIALAALIAFSMAACGDDNSDGRPGGNTPAGNTPGGSTLGGGDTTGGVPVTGVTLNKSSISLTVGNKETLTATVAPNNAANKALTWSTSNAAAATVANGVVTAVAAGEATITVTTTDGGKTAACSVTVTASVAPGVFTLTDIPSQYNGRYMMVSADGDKSFTCTSGAVSTSSWYFPEIKDGMAKIALYAAYNTADRFTGTKLVNVEIIIRYDASWQALGGNIIMLKIGNVSFTNGRATVSAKNARWYTLSGTEINYPTD